ncbi:hypothetical protein [Streptomyces anulatus]|uniref:hypothetical protein n=1 Tax=Streptomyces anulatus TaxID=1892 RepID=UPI003867F7BB|nr:hypothetical protein OG238_40815 [Streptomyces anulatus]WSW80754.1 hypothetical protein OG536_00130 [Streptomyces anulatus]
MTPNPVRISGRNVQNWAVTPSRGAAVRIAQEVARALHQWGYRPKDDQPQKVVELLLRSAAEDGGRRVSLHLADDEDRNQVMLPREIELRPPLAPARRGLDTDVAGAEGDEGSHALVVPEDLVIVARRHVLPVTERQDDRARELETRAARAVCGPLKMGHPPA